MGSHLSLWDTGKPPHHAVFIFPCEKLGRGQSCTCSPMLRVVYTVSWTFPLHPLISSTWRKAKIKTVPLGSWENPGFLDFGFLSWAIKAWIRAWIFCSPHNHPQVPTVYNQDTGQGVGNTILRFTRGSLSSWPLSSWDIDHRAPDLATYSYLQAEARQYTPERRLSHLLWSPISHSKAHPPILAGPVLSDLLEERPQKAHAPPSPA